MNAAVISFVTLCTICSLLLPVTAPAATHTPSSTLVLQCGDTQAAESAPAVAPPQPEQVSMAPASAVASAPSPVPEPASVVLLGLGLALGILRMRFARRTHDST
jgi:hypothetical protein